MARIEAYTSDLNDAEWEAVRGLLPERGKLGRPPRYERRLMVNAIFYITRSGCAWRDLPHDFPHWRLVYYYFSKWHRLTTYKLQPSDFRFISPPKASAIPKPASPPPVFHAKDAGAKNLPAPSTAPSRPTVTYEELLAVSYSAYRTPWEFVAERFHCDEAFLRRLNSNIKTVPTAETVFKVPNVTPFEIEKCFDSPLRPKADPEKPITAAIVEHSRLEIHQGDQLIASMPMSIAMPGLHGKGSWKILGAIAGPRLATRQEPTTTPKTTAEPGVADPLPTPSPTPASIAPEQILPAGPRNPVGVYWIDLAKADSTTPLPYGLHGTAIPSRMKTQQSLGGLRLTNWDIARAVRMLPEGTPLAWK